MIAMLAITLLVHARSMWVWTAPSNATLIRFAQTHGVSELFYYVSPDVAVPGPERTRALDLSRRAGAAGIALEALNGDPTWADNATETSNAILWEDSAMGTGFFVGAHFDIEPSPPLGTGCNQAQATAFLAALRAIHANSMAHGWGMNVDAQIGDSLCLDPSGYATLTDGIIANADEITVMSYRKVASGGNGLWDVCLDSMTRAHAAGKGARCGAEPAYDLPSSITFYGKTARAMNAVLGQVDVLAQHSVPAAAYRGIAIEDYAGYAGMKP